MGAVSTSAIPNLCSETLTDGAGGFLPDVPLGCLGHGDRTKSRDAPDLSGAIRERPGPREAMSDNLTQESNAGHSGAFLDKGRSSSLWRWINLRVPARRRP